MRITWHYSLSDARVISLFSFLEVFDLGEDFCGPADDFLVHSHSNEASDKTSEDRSCAESHGHR